MTEHNQTNLQVCPRYIVGNQANLKRLIEHLKQCNFEPDCLARPHNTYTFCPDARFFDCGSPANLEAHVVNLTAPRHKALSFLTDEEYNVEFCHFLGMSPHGNTFYNALMNREFDTNQELDEDFSPQLLAEKLGIFVIDTTVKNQTKLNDLIERFRCCGWEKAEKDTKVYSQYRFNLSYNYFAGCLSPANISGHIAKENGEPALAEPPARHYRRISEHLGTSHAHACYLYFGKFAPRTPLEHITPPVLIAYLRTLLTKEVE